MIKRIVAVAAAAVAISGVALMPAKAADIPMMPVVAPPPPPAPVGADWGGFYVGVLGDIQFVSFGGIAGPYFPWLGVGARAGYNFDAGNWVVGIEGTVEWSASLPFPPTFTALELAAVARAGFEVAGGKALIYGVAGGGLLRNLTLALNAGFWTVGAGMEVMVTDSLSLRTDYRFQGFPGFPGIISHNFSVGVSFYLGR